MIIYEKKEIRVIARSAADEAILKIDQIASTFAKATADKSGATGNDEKQTQK